jgi:type VI secretion system ImpA family protein
VHIVRDGGNWQIRPERSFTSLDLLSSTEAHRSVSARDVQAPVGETAVSQPTLPSVDEFLNPVSESNPVGSYLCFEDDYFELQEARSADDDASSRGDWARQRKTSDWNKIIGLGEMLLREKSKDLQIAAWVTEALAQVHGLAGMRQGLHLLRELQNRFWERAHPAEGDLELRQGVYEFLDHEKILPLQVRSVPLTRVNGAPELSYSYLKYREARESENLAKKPPKEVELDELLAGRLRSKEFDDAVEATDRQFYLDLLAEVRECEIAIEQLNDGIKERWSAKTPVPRLTRVPVALQDVKKLAKQLLDHKPAPVVSDEPEVEDTEDVSQEEEEAVQVEPEAREARKRQSKPQVVSYEQISSDEQARQSITQAAHFLRRSNPADPTPYLLLSALGIGELYQNSDSLEASAFPSPSSEVRERLHGLEKSADDEHWAKLLEESAQVIGQPEGRGWLDLHRYSLMAMAALGYVNAERACKAVLSTCLRDHPQWIHALLKDGTPCASEATRDWISTERIAGPSELAEKLDRLKESEHSFETSQDPADNELKSIPSEVDPWEQAQSMVRAGNVSDAIAVMARAARQAGSGRERFLRTLQQAELCLALERSVLALPLLDVLAQRVDDFRLEQWEDGSLSVRVFSNLYRCLRGQDETRARTVYNRLCQLDLSEALALGGG